ncbi:MAG: S-layer homology domain-containing protein, partial [Syntrophomonadaceae bacterium]
PAPLTPTFGDVPASHPFFQYIEALAASGITGGCGGGNYCPNNPNTRGQMAVFLTKTFSLVLYGP